MLSIVRPSSRGNFCLFSRLKECLFGLNLPNKSDKLPGSTGLFTPEFDLISGLVQVGHALPYAEVACLFKVNFDPILVSV